MNKTSCFLAMLGVGLSMIGLGCQTASDEELAAMDLEGYGYAPQENPSGAGTSNHLLPSTYHSHKYKLLAAMSHPLGTRHRSPDVGIAEAHMLSADILDTGILDTEQGQELLQMAVECALADGQSVSHGNSGRTYTGKGLMSTTASWYSEALSTAQKEDVLRCVIARVNMYGDSVRVVIAGQNVTDQPDEHHTTAHWVPDAVWDVRITATPTESGTLTTIEEYAWPLADIRANAASSQCLSVRTAMQSRVCDEASSNCSFHVGELPANVRSRYTFTRREGVHDAFEPNDPTAGRPTVQSWVEPHAIVDLYVGCLQNAPQAPAMNPIDGPHQP